MKLPPWVINPERLPDRFWKRQMNRRFAQPDPEWFPILESVMLNQGITSAQLEHWKTLRLLAFDVTTPWMWPGPVEANGDPIVQLKWSRGDWGSECRLRAEHAIWMYMYPELVESRKMSCRWIRPRRFHQEVQGLNVNPWYHWPGNTQQLYLKMLLGGDLWFEWQSLKKQSDAPVFVEEDTPISVLPELNDDEFEFLD